MGSSKRNTSSAKPMANTQTAECIAALEIELKVVGDDRAEAGEHGTETQALAPSAAQDAEPNAGEQGAAAEESFAKPTEPAVSKENGADLAARVAVTPSSEPAEKPATPNLSLHASAIPLSLKPEMSIDWPLSRKRQLFNIVYFGLITWQLVVLGQSGATPWLVLACLALVVPLGAASFFYLFNHRAHQTSSEDFTPAMRRSLRAAALLVPAFMMFGLVQSDVTQQYPPSLNSSIGPPAALLPVDTTFAGEMALGKRDFNHHRYQNALGHFQSAAGIDPSSDLAAEWIANTNDSMFRFPEALTAALHAIDLNPDNENAHVISAHAYNMMGQFPNALEMSKQAIALNPDDGEAYGYGSTALNGLGRYAEALAYDNNHVRLHYYEPQSFEQRARTLRSLGRMNESNYDMQLAENIRKHGSN